jgi:hypothetical protein
VCAAEQPNGAASPGSGSGGDATANPTNNGLVRMVASTVTSSSLGVFFFFAFRYSAISIFKQCTVLQFDGTGVF